MPGNCHGLFWASVNLGPNYDTTPLRGHCHTGYYSLYEWFQNMSPCAWAKLTFNFYG
jgi:hypothetical protein